MPETTVVPERYERIPLDHVRPSKTNPRTHFDDHYLGELSKSIREKGVVQPILVRPHGRNGAFEIVAGECRFRASKLAQVVDIPAIVRQLTDEQVLELQLIENIHRRDLTPMEQAIGFRRLIDANPTKHSAESIAQRLGMSPQWVWDRMKLNDLIPEAKKLLDTDRISVGHAILIARLKHEDQMRVIAPGDRRAGYGVDGRGGLWDHEDGLPYDTDERKSDKYYGLKAVTVRELDHWINDHVRFDVEHAAQAAPLEFEPIAERVQAAEAKPGKGKKVIAITYEHFTQPEARDDEERTYGPKSWKRADGTKQTTPVGMGSKMVDSPTCEFAVLGVVVAGDDRGQAFDVCIAREKCTVHWKQEVAAKKKRETAKKSGKSLDARKAAQVRETLREQREAEQRKAREERWKAFKPALVKAVNGAVTKLPAKLPAPLYAKALAAHHLPAATKPADLAKALLIDAISDDFRSTWHGDEARMVAWAKLLKVDVKACEPKVQTSGESTHKQTPRAGAK